MPTVSWWAMPTLRMMSSTPPAGSPGTACRVVSEPDHPSRRAPRRPGMVPHPGTVWVGWGTAHPKTRSGLRPRRAFPVTPRPPRPAGTPAATTARVRPLHCCFTAPVESLNSRTDCLFQWDRTSAIMTTRGPSRGAFSEGRFSFPGRVRFASVRAPYGKSHRAGRAAVGWVWRSNE